MNRIILIGNGFDLAHGLKTGYKDFIDSYWTDFTYSIYNGYNQWIGRNYGIVNLKSYEDDFVSFQVKDKSTPTLDKLGPSCEAQNPYSELCDFLNEVNKSNNHRIIGHLTFKNQFFKHISNQCSLLNWVDIENEYYGSLKKLLAEDDSQKRNELVKTLNRDFNAVKGLLEKYLISVTENEEKRKHQSIEDAFFSSIDYDDISHAKQNDFLDSILSKVAENKSYHIFPNPVVNRQDVLGKLKDEFFKKNYCLTNSTLILNFNYTRTAESLYAGFSYEVINIHGELNSKQNPIIFGYGDELDDDYKTIEKLQDNEFLENIKSINYHKTRNYRRLLGFIQFEPYQVFIMGHSCGNSDRTLLNTLFEHENCASVKVFYHQKEEGKDDYSNLIRNISRNFNDKARMRDTVVNWERCLPLVPFIKQEESKESGS